jgi:pullulanase
VPTTPLDTLGAIYTPASTTFRIWSPDSSTVSVTIEGTSHPMSLTTLPGYTDVYQTVVMGDQNGKTYQFRINNIAVRDPYAQMVSGGTSQTESIVINDAAVVPSDGSWAPRPALVNREDSVLYELHVRGFTPGIQWMPPSAGSTSGSCRPPPPSPKEPLRSKRASTT